jgi:hypothetical protein
MLRFRVHLSYRGLLAKTQHSAALNKSYEVRENATSPKDGGGFGIRKRGAACMARVEEQMPFRIEFGVKC